MKQGMKSPAELLTPGRALTLANVAEGAEGLVVSDLARAIPQLVKADRRIAGWRSATEYRDLYPVAIAVALAATAVLGLLA